MYPVSALLSRTRTSDRTACPGPTPSILSTRIRVTYPDGGFSIGGNFTPGPMSPPPTSGVILARHPLECAPRHRALHTR